MKELKLSETTVFFLLVNGKNFIFPHKILQCLTLNLLNEICSYVYQFCLNFKPLQVISLHANLINRENHLLENQYHLTRNVL